MSNKPFDRIVENLLERPLSSDNNQGQTAWATAIVDLLYRQYASRTTIFNDVANPNPPVGAAAFVNAGFKVRGSAVAMTVSLDQGLGFFNDNITTLNLGNVSGVNDNEVIKPLVLTLNETINVPAADPSNPRIDIVEVQSGRQFTDATSRDVFNPSAAAFQPNSVNKTLTYACNGRSTVNGAGPINYKTGTPAGSPVAPAADSGYSVIARVWVNANASAIGSTGIMDLRRMLFNGGILEASAEVDFGSAGGGVPTLHSIQAPPGIEMTAIYNGTTLQAIAKVGDANALSGVGGINGIVVRDINLASAGLGVTSTVANGPIVTSATASAAVCATAAAANPSMLLQVGQPYLVIPLLAGFSAVNGNVTFTMRYQY